MVDNQRLTDKPFSDTTTIEERLHRQTTSDPSPFESGNDATDPSSSLLKTLRSTILTQDKDEDKAGDEADDEQKEEDSGDPDSPHRRSSASVSDVEPLSLQPHAQPQPQPRRHVSRIQLDFGQWLARDEIDHLDPWAPAVAREPEEPIGAALTGQFSFCITSNAEIY